jgi:hypothetical protein
MEIPDKTRKPGKAAFVGKYGERSLQACDTPKMLDHKVQKGSSLHMV